MILYHKTKPIQQQVEIKKTSRVGLLQLFKLIEGQQQGTIFFLQHSLHSSKPLVKDTVSFCLIFPAHFSQISKPQFMMNAYAARVHRAVDHIGNRGEERTGAGRNAPGLQVEDNREVARAEQVW